MSTNDSAELMKQCSAKTISNYRILEKTGGVVGVMVEGEDPKCTSK
jgi:hypothetical protein